MKKAAGSLERMLRVAAVADNWSHVIHRCAWCERSFDRTGAYTNVVARSKASLTTDGMCPACGARALAQIGERRRLRGRLAA
jgi:DNA-directed RNA polymerase subunit RPC12/RpoP